ncbi:prephenate dehydrogenase/arogenate dehydrogenase family protein [Reinekea blandensis]|uniref:prephenate dehydrogenase n=1 Tax=Reinekea blandensis MED297 TaxID=314283 RepID=A4BEF0_9GAMM|nr:prephenate dehydrogenase/arogenate dehydrogenase family protein [Reinekea blandensis]EAR09377.1 Prephenate dehydrogenase [Reinekea sp. MED297] [Reinekea blandensis MED297]
MIAKPKVLVIGLGLIGASFAKSLKQQQLAELYGYDQDPTVPETAKAMGVIDVPVGDLADVLGMDAVVLAVPVMAMPDAVRRIRHLIPTLTALTDVGSVKQAVVDSVRQELGELPGCFVPGHPIAGAEKSGVTAAQADLFDRHMHILTPTSASTPEAIELVRSLWAQCGAQVVEMPVERHDEVLAATSHLPHLLAFSLVDTLARESENREIFKYAAGGFRDFSRIAASDPTMWHDIFLMNSEATLKILRRFQADLHLLEEAIEHRDGDLLRTVFTRAKSARDYFTEIMEERQKGPEPK